MSRCNDCRDPPGGAMSKRKPQFILKPRRTVLLELGLQGKFIAKSSGWDESRVFLESNKLELAVKNGLRVLTCPRARDRRPNCSDAIFRTTETALQRW